VRLLDHFGEGITAPVRRVDGDAEERVHEGTGIEGIALVPDHGENHVEVMAGEKAHRFGDVLAAEEDLAVDVGQPDPAQLRLRFLGR